MNKHILLGLLILYWIGGTVHLYAQNQAAPLRISAQLVDQTLPDIFQSLEKQYPLHFYYRADELPKGKFSLQVQDVELERALQQLLNESKLGFFSLPQLWRGHCSAGIGQRRF